jgi:hypothetical protein
MLEPRSELISFKWRRTAFARIDCAIDIAEDDWSLLIDGLSAACIYRVQRAPRRPMVLGRPDRPWSRPIQQRDG